MRIVRRFILSCTCLLALVCLLCTVALRRARASVFETLLGLGDRMAPYLNDRNSTEKPRLMVINGQKVWLAVGRTSHAPARVKDWYLDRYGGADDAVAELARAQHFKSTPPPTQFSFGDDEDGGMVALDMGAKLTARELITRWSRFVQSSRLGDVGQMRFVRWMREPDGGTRFLTLWTDTRFSLDGLLPPKGTDVAGEDLPDVPRPPGMTRVLAIEEVGRPYRARTYEGPGGVAQVAAQLGFDMRRRGWSEETGFDDSSPDSVSMRFKREGRSVTVGIDGNNDGTVDVGIIDGGGR